MKNLISERLDHKKVDAFLSQTEFINGKSKNTQVFDIEMKKGSMIIFDELCTSWLCTKKNNRIVLRYLYRKKLY